MNDEVRWFDILFNLSLSFFGGLVKSMTSKEAKTLEGYVCSAIVGGFAGLLTYMLCANFDMNVYMTGFATGIAGYMGDSILNVFSKILPNFFAGKFNISIEENETGKEEDK